jgi:hypothetical protein
MAVVWCVYDSTGARSCINTVSSGTAPELRYLGSAVLMKGTVP